MERDSRTFPAHVITPQEMADFLDAHRIQMASATCRDQLVRKTLVAMPFNSLVYEVFTREVTSSKPKIILVTPNLIDAVKAYNDLN